jgi:hypothetical protein
MKDYIDKILAQFGMSNCKSRTTPIDYRYIPKCNNALLSTADIEYMSTVPYANAVGSLMYLAITCRPDIAYVVSLFSRFMQSPCREHWEGVKNIFRYLKYTSSLGITYGDKSRFNARNQNVNLLEAYSDSDWAGCNASRRSLSGYVLMLNGGPIQWKSKLQTIVSQSSTEAEYIALATVCNELVWIKRIAAFLHIPQTACTVYVDNRSAICMSESQKDDRRTKHIDVRYHMIKDLVSSKQISLVHIDGKKNPADIFTKSQTIIMFLAMRMLLLRF